MVKAEKAADAKVMAWGSRVGIANQEKTPCPWTVRGRCWGVGRECQFIMIRIPRSPSQGGVPSALALELCFFHNDFLWLRLFNRVMLKAPWKGQPPLSTFNVQIFNLEAKFFLIYKPESHQEWIPNISPVLCVFVCILWKQVFDHSLFSGLLWNAYILQSHFN